MKPITKLTWKGFSGKQKWDCLVALRGPDCSDPSCIKWFTTGVIRQRLRDAIRVGGMINEHLGCVIVPAYVPTVNGFNLCHFMQHTFEAAEILSIPILTIEHSVWDGVMKGGSRSKAALEIYRAVMGEDVLASEYTSVCELRRFLVEDLSLINPVAEIEEESKNATY